MIRMTVSQRSNRRSLLATVAISATLAIGACDSENSGPAEPPSSDFLDGASEDTQIGLIVNSTGHALRMFQVGDRSEVREVALGASSAVTPTGLSVRGERATVPLGNAASVALISLREQRIEEFYLFASGNASGSAWFDDNTVIVSNMTTAQVGRFTLSQSDNVIGNLVEVAPTPSTIVMAGDRALVVSSNLNEDFAPIGHGVITAINPTTMQVIGTVETGGNNPQSASLGPDGMLYVINTENYFDPGSLAIINPATLELVEVIADFGVGPGSIHVDAGGLVYVSGFFFGTLVWDTATKTFVRGTDNPVCAPLPDDGCRGAFSVSTGDNGNLYQSFFGSSTQGLSPWIFVYAQGSFALTDSIESGQGPVAVRVGSF